MSFPRIPALRVCVCAQRLQQGRQLVQGDTAGCSSFPLSTREQVLKSPSVRMTHKLYEKDFICACSVYSATPKRRRAEQKSRMDHPRGLTDLLLHSCLLSSYLTITNVKVLLTSHDRKSCFISAL